MEFFKWGNIKAIYWSVAIFIAFAFMLRGYIRKIKIIETLVSKNLIENLVIFNYKKVYLLRALFLLIAIGFMVVTIMQPKYGFFWESIEKKGVDIFVALDVSKSMLAKDIFPSRIERSRLEIKNFIKKLTGDRVGLILFTSQAITQCPLTLDYVTFESFLDESYVGVINRGGTSLSKVIDQSLISFDQAYKKNRILIIVTDGESHDKRLVQSIEKAVKNNIIIFTIGVGSKEGANISSSQKEDEFLKDQHGNLILSKLNETDLIELALETNGAYIHANEHSFGLEKIYLEKISVLEGRKLKERRKKRFKHRFYIPLILAILFLMMETLLNEKK